MTGYKRPDDWEPPKVSLEGIEFFDDEEVTIDEAQERQHELEEALYKLSERIDEVDVTY